MLAPRLGIFAVVSLLLCSCSSSSSAPPNTPEEQAQRPDAPLMAAQPGAWFDAEGSLTVVGAGRRLRLHLSAPITACSPAFEGPGTADQVAERASLSFRVLSEACRHDHPEILLPAEGETASPAERERSYREVARCASHDLGATSGWLPRAVAARDPCPVALGLGWRLPQVAELQGLGVDDRKAVAGALFDTEDRAGFGSLLLYAHDGGGKLTLVTLSPNAAEQAPSLNDDLAGKPFFGAALRCVRDTPPTPAGATPTPTPPPLPNASQCMRELRASQSKLRVAPQAQLPELQRLKAWLEQVERAPALLQSEASLRDLGALLATPSLERLAQEAREERALTERYAELAESLDAPDVSAAERERRRAEFDELRKRLGGKIVDSAVAGGGERPALSALLARSLQLLEETAARATSGKPKAGKLKQPDYSAVIARLRALRGEKATTP
jgi:hypothetical protein